MNLYVVSKASQEKDSSGILLKAYARVFGVFTVEERANVIAEKHQASVTTFVADQEKMITIEEWLNPGFVEGG